MLTRIQFNFFGGILNPFVTCVRCLCDTTISSITFDASGVCNFCKSHDRVASRYPLNSDNLELSKLVDAIKKSGSGKTYDCLVGVSGGTDSSFTLWWTKQLGLKPLAVHFDNGWNTEQSVRNIKRITDKLDVDLITYVVEWEEFKDLQLSFLKAAVPCIETPTDVAIHSVLYQTAAKEGIQYILGGQSFRTEGTVPREWSYLDSTYIQTVHRKFGKVALHSYPQLSLPKIFYYTFIRGIRNIPLLNYTEYNKIVAKEKLRIEFDWSDYGGHHYENIYSQFAFGWYLPRKFGIDKRKISLSGPVRSGQMSREEAVSKLELAPPVSDDIIGYVTNKLGITQTQFDSFMTLPPRSFRDYFTSYDFLKHLRIPVKVAVKMKFFTPVLYEKYYG
jgi:N-acetyl sugar amidotransferase